MTYGLGGLYPLGYDGTGAGVAEFDLDDYRGGLVNIRFQFGSDFTEQYAGINIDNLRISGDSGACNPQPSESDWLLLDGIEYDNCPATLIGHFSPEGSVLETGAGLATYGQTRAVFVGCNFDVRQQYQRYDTKLTFEVWNANELKLTGAHDCADGWHETYLTNVKTQGSNFSLASLRTDIARYRVTPTKDDAACGRATAKVGLLGVQSTEIQVDGGFTKVGTGLAAAGTYPGFIVWSGVGPVEEGQIR